MLRVGISGLTGMIGRNFVDHYRRDPETRKRFSLVAFTRRASCPDFLEQAGIPWHRVDYADPDCFTGLVGDLDAFVHLAGQVRATDPREFFRANRDGTAGMLEGLARHGRRVRHFLFASSQTAAGPSGADGVPADERLPPRPVSHYGRSKLEAEEAVRASALNWTILRLAAVWGPYDRDGLSLLRMARGGVLPLIGGQQAVLSYIFAQDLARLLPQMILNERLFRGTFNVCYDDPIAFSDYCRAVRGVLGLSPRLLQLPLPRWTGHAAIGALALARRVLGGGSIVGPDKLREIMALHWVLSNGRLKEALGRPVLRESGALAETVRWFREHGLL